MIYIINKLRATFNTGVTKSFTYRLNNLKKLYKMITENENKIIIALNKDLNKSASEAFMTEIGFTLKELSFTIKHVRKWMKTKKVKTPLFHFPGKSYQYQEPYGVCLIMSPWNYPFQLTMVPLIGALAAGNCVVLKPSQYSQATSKLIKELISKYFDENYIYVVEGGKGSK